VNVLHWWTKEHIFSYEFLLKKEVYSQTSVHERLGTWTVQFTNKSSEHKASRMMYCTSYEHTSCQHCGAISWEYQRWQYSQKNDIAENTPSQQHDRRGRQLLCSFHSLEFTVPSVHSNSLCLLLYFSVFYGFCKLLNRTPWGQRKTMIAAKWKEKIPV
jgi:hypothetical protein